MVNLYATVIQAWYRGVSGRDWFLERVCSAYLIQGLWRGAMQRMRDVKGAWAALKFQAAWRGWKGRLAARRKREWNEVRGLLAGSTNATNDKALQMLRLLSS